MTSNLVLFFSEFFGSDAETGYPLTYIWNANQFGHINLGFLGAHLIVWITSLGYLMLPNHTLTITNKTWIALGWLTMWLVKEVFDYKYGIAQPEGSTFSLEKSRILVDCLEDSAFYIIGVTLYIMEIHKTNWIFPTIGVSIALYLAIASVRLPEKSALDKVRLPYIHSLSKFYGPLSTPNPARLEDFARNNQNQFDHVVIAAPQNSGKTPLLVGLGMERVLSASKSDREFSARYLTFFKFLQLASHADGDPEIGHEYRNPWSKSTLLLIDDVDAGIAPLLRRGPEPIVSADDVVRAIESLPREARELLKSKQTIWVVGIETDIDTWIKSLAKALDTSPDRIMPVVLGEIPGPA